MTDAVIQTFPYDKNVDVGEITGDFTIDFDSSTKKKLIAIAGDGAYILSVKGKFDYSTDETLADSKIKAVTLEADLGEGPLPYLQVTDFKAKLGFFFPEISDGVMTPSTAGDFNAILFADDDEIIGGPLNDVLSGQGEDDKVVGSEGADLIFGDAEIPAPGDEGGNDKVVGNEGDDSLFGDGNPLETPEGFKGGTNKLNGGEDNDFLIGGFGKDTMIGGEGLDTFIMHLNAGKKDVVKDFDPDEDGLSVVELGLGSGEEAFDFLDTNDDGIINKQDDYATVKKGSLKLNLGQAAEDAGVEDAGVVILTLNSVKALGDVEVFVDTSIEDALLIA
jgi:Ca2+-binding RTX toxin-like protein